MPITIIADLITENGRHTITLPQSQNMFDNHLNAMNIFIGDTSEYKIIRVLSWFDGLDKYIAFADNIEELNYLAQLLDRFSEEEMKTYEKFLICCTSDVTMQYLINLAYNFHEDNGEQYDGKFFPEFDYESGYFMKIKLSLPNESSGIYIYLPANQSVITRALYKLGVKSIDECTVDKCPRGTFQSIKQLIM